MKKLLKNILLVASVLLIAASCEKSPTGKNNLSGIPILLTATEAGDTKAILNSESFSKIGNELQIYDYYTPVATEESPTPTPHFYIKDQVRSNGSSWPFVKGKYEWTTDGVHKFYGWLAKDANFDNSETEDDESMTADEFFNNGFSFSEENQKLTIGNKVLGQTTEQYDFMYSKIITRDLNDEIDYSPVKMEFNHLFTAFKFSAQNTSTNTVKLKSVTLSGLKDSRSATIDYSTDGDKPTISYHNVNSIGTFEFNTVTNDVGLELPKTQVQLSDDYFLMWPHTKNDFKPTETLPAATITVVYDYFETDDEGNVTLEQLDQSKSIYLQDIAAWEAGKKYDLNLQFKDKEIILECTVQNWIPVVEEIDFTEQVSGSLPLTWEEETVDEIIEEEGKVILYSSTSKTAICRFKIDTPRGATWTASLISIEGHQDAFSIVEDTKYGPVGVECAIKIRVNNPDPIAPRHVCLLRITVQTADGRTIVVNNMMPEETPTNITEYSIIQNLING